jgi:hypothetical protein
VRRLLNWLADFAWLYRDNKLTAFFCFLAGHPPGPIYRGFKGHAADMRCRACGMDVTT